MAKIVQQYDNLLESQDQQDGMVSGQELFAYASLNLYEGSIHVTGTRGASGSAGISDDDKRVLEENARPWLGSAPAQELPLPRRVSDRESRIVLFGDSTSFFKNTRGIKEIGRSLKTHYLWNLRFRAEKGATADQIVKQIKPALRNSRPPALHQAALASVALVVVVGKIAAAEYELVGARHQ